VQSWEEGRTDQDREEANKYHKGNEFAKKSARKEERMLKGTQKQFIYTFLKPTEPTQPLLGWWWHTPSCFLSTFYVLIPPQPLVFFNEIGQFDKGQMTKLKQNSLSLARGSFTRSLKPWASTNRTDESVGEKKREKYKEAMVYHCYSVTMTHIRQSVGILPVTTLPYHEA
jgi:hypothetical protein